MQSLPKDFVSYKKTPDFNENTVPKGLLKAHQTKAGTWGKIVVLEGELLYRILEPETEEHVLNSNHIGIVEPEILHEVEPNGAVTFYVEFYRSS